MKTVLMLFFAAILMGGVSEAVELNVKQDGEFRFRHENYDIYSGRSDKVDFTTLRLRFGLDFDLGEDRHVYISPQAVKGFGELNPETQSNGSTSFRQTSGDQYDKELDFYEAYASVPVGPMRFKVGRQVLSYGENVMIGDRNWTPRGQAFDA
ncbi:MAG: hypothetical protein GW917_03645, partial [Bdellovibrionales bacterium]|nr:hypothetical protein [Bdellovibrionales bacterium]